MLQVQSALYLKECTKLPTDYINKQCGSGIGESLHCDKHRHDRWSRGIVATMGGTVWAGGSGVYQQQKPGSWTKICDGVQWGSVITSCNGKVISIGGAKDGHYSNCVKILDEASRKWAAMPSMIVPCHDPCVW